METNLTLAKISAFRSGASTPSSGTEMHSNSKHSEIWEKIKTNTNLPRHKRRRTKECVLFLYLAYNLSRRRINWLLGSKSHFNGNAAQRIITEYSLNSYGGKLFGYPAFDSCEVIDKLMSSKKQATSNGGNFRQAIKQIFEGLRPPSALRLSASTALILPTGTQFRSEIYGAQMTNLVNKWFKELRTRFECHCHYYTPSSKHCTDWPLETAHYASNRATMIDDLAVAHRVPCDTHGVVSAHQGPATHYRYNLEDIYKQFLVMHMQRVAHTSGKTGLQDPVLFFCRRHHKEYDGLVDRAKTCPAVQRELRDWQTQRIKPYL